MRAPAKPRAPRRRALGVRRRYRGCVLRRIGTVTVVVENEGGTVLGWAASFAQGKQFVDWTRGFGEERS